MGTAPAPRWSSSASSAETVLGPPLISLFTALFWELTRAGTELLLSLKGAGLRAVSFLNLGLGLVEGVSFVS